MQKKRSKRERFEAWINGEVPSAEEQLLEEEGRHIYQRTATVQAKRRHKNPREYQNAFEIKAFQKVYNILSVVFCLALIFSMLITVSYLPRVGGAENPGNNEVAERYIEKGLEETGAVNIVAGMILDYRAFDTFGESCVLFCAVCSVFILLKVSDREAASENDRVHEPKNDVILQQIARIIVPLGLVFGIYVVLNGHLSAGGGFSGGAIMGAVLVLYLLAFGFEKTERFFNEKVFRVITCSALSFYCLAKSYSFFTGANHLESIISTGTPGAIISAGLILPLNICVGLVVACTMYAFYTMFRKGGM